jgi:hypothetical protein
MMSTSICLIFSFILSAVASVLLVSKIAALMVVNLLVASVLVVGFIWSVTRYGRKPIWWLLGGVGVVTVVLLIAYLMDRSPFEAGYVPLIGGEVLAMNIWVVGESAYRICRKTSPARARLVTATVTLSGLTLGWLNYFWFFFLFKNA